MGRAPCCDKIGLKKGPWTPEEDQKLIDYIQKHGHGSWRTLPKNAGLARCGKSCRLRWTNYLRPDIKRGRFTFEEEETIIQLHSMLGNKWSAIAARLPGRTDNEIKNYWNTHVRKRLLRMGIDPVTHAPRLDLLDLSSLLNPTSFNNTTLHNPFDLLKFLALDPLLNSESLRIATALFSSQNQSSTSILHQNQLQASLALERQQLIASIHAQQQLQLHSSTSSTNSQFINDQHQQPQLMQSNIVSQYSNMWQDTTNTTVIAQPNFEDSYETLDQGDIPNLSFSEDCNNIYDENYGLMSSVLSTPESSPTTNLNSSSTYLNSSTTEDEDSYCIKSLFKFQIPNLLDVSDYF